MRNSDDEITPLPEEETPPTLGISVGEEVEQEDGLVA